LNTSLPDSLEELKRSISYVEESDKQDKDIRKINFMNDYALDVHRPSRDPNNPYAEDKIRRKKINIDFKNYNQLFNIIKKRKEFINWQPSRDDRSKILKALNDIDKS